eukprot:GEMP01026073.1.p1 GENE.GEMP01026073.1~~GEMP01026073.1.p1  ORF type:complete len:767 (-),score=127.54 GEMP01026073.1:86-2197(-)
MDRRKKGARADNLLNFTSHREESHGNYRSDASWNNYRYAAPTRRIEKGRYVQTFRCHILDTTPFEQVAGVINEVDALLPWEVVRRVDLMTEKSFSCPVCLDDAITVPKITKCGHVFCVVCIIRHLIRDTRSGLAAGDSGSRRCPVCNDGVSVGDLRTVRFQRVGESKELVLCRKAPDSRGLTLLAHAPPLPCNRSLREVPREGDEGWHFSRLVACSLDQSSRQTYEECAALHDFRAQCIQNVFGDTEMLPFVDYVLNRMYVDVEQDDVQARPLDPYFRVQLPKRSKGMSKGSSRLTRASTCQAAASTHQLPPPRPLAEEEYRIPLEQPGAGSAEDPTRSPGSNSKARTAKSEDGNEPGEDGSPKSVDSWLAPISQGTRLEVALPLTSDCPVDVEDDNYARDSGFSFYQMSDGQQIYLHPFWHKPMLACFKRYHLMPAVLKVPLADVEETSVTPETRHNSGFFQQLTLGTAVKFVDADLRRILDGATKRQFAHDFKERRRLQEQEKRRQRKDENWVASKATKAEAEIKEQQLSAFRCLPYTNERVPTRDDFVPLPGAQTRPDAHAVPSDAEVEAEPSGPTLAERLRTGQKARPIEGPQHHDIQDEMKGDKALEYYPPLPTMHRTAGPNLQPIAWGKGVKAKAKAEAKPKENIDNAELPTPIEGVPDDRPEGLNFADIVARQQTNTKKKKPQAVRLFGLPSSFYL